MRGAPAVERVSGPAHVRRIRSLSPSPHRRLRLVRPTRRGFDVKGFIDGLVNSPRDTSPVIAGPLR
jgi:hypothetical protein